MSRRRQRVRRPPRQRREAQLCAGSFKYQDRLRTLYRQARMETIMAALSGKQALQSRDAAGAAS